MTVGELQKELEGKDANLDVQITSKTVHELIYIQKPEEAPVEPPPEQPVGAVAEPVEATA